MRGPRLYLRLLAVDLRSQWQYQTNLLLRSIGHLLVTVTDFLGIWILVGRFGPLLGWSLAELAVLYGTVNVSFALAQMFARGFDTFDGLIRRGEFDRVLLRPRSTVLQLAGQALPLHQLGRLAQGLGLLGWGLASSGVGDPGALALLAWAVLGGCCLYAALAVAQATTAFWTVEGLEVFNVTTYGGAMAASYPPDCYRPGLRWMLFTVVPVALVAYPPCLWVLDRSAAAGWSTAACWTAPLAGPLLLLFAGGAWRLGLRRYASTGS